MLSLMVLQEFTRNSSFKVHLLIAIIIITIIINISFNLPPPTYQEITNYQVHEILRFTMSVRPDQISIIYFKLCPYLRSFIFNICTKALGSNTLSAQWIKAATILIHKKGDPSLPENFRPITLEPVSLQIFMSLF